MRLHQAVQEDDPDREAKLNAQREGLHEKERSGKNNLYWHQTGSLPLDIYRVDVYTPDLEFMLHVLSEEGPASPYRVMPIDVEMCVSMRRIVSLLATDQTFWGTVFTPGGTLSEGLFSEHVVGELRVILRTLSGVDSCTAVQWAAGGAPGSSISTKY